MMFERKTVVGAMLLSTCLVLSACDGEGLSFGRFTAGSGKPEATGYFPPEADERGIITYQSYQVAVARRGDTVRAMAERFGQDVGAMSSLNGIHADTTLRMGEVVVLPDGVNGADIIEGRIVETPIRQPGEVDIETIASNAIAAADPGTASTSVDKPTLTEPLRYRVKSGDTATSIAKAFDISVRALADWNGLGTDNTVRVGQSLLIPPPNTVVTPITRPAEEPEAVSKPGTGSNVGQPPSASQPLPENPSASETKETETPAAKPAEAGGSLMLPVNGSIIQDFQKGKSDGIDISAPAGSPVVAAGDGTVAAITQDAGGVPILVIRHGGGLLTVYAGIDKITVARGDHVKRGQQIAVVRAGSPAALHFETRRGFESVDPADFLN